MIVTKQEIVTYNTLQSAKGDRRLALSLSITVKHYNDFMTTSAISLRYLAKRKASIKGVLKFHG